MPKRSNWFQSLIRIIESHLAPENAKVTESAMLKDFVTEADREVDILIETRSGTHEIILAVECVGATTRPVDVTWVEKIACKHQHLPIDRSILVSRTGFSKNAERKAQALRMETLSLSDALSLDWKSKLREWPKVLRIKIPKLLDTQILLSCQDDGGHKRLQELGNTALAESTIYAESGANLGKFSDLIIRVLNDDRVRQLEGKYPAPGHEGVWMLPVELADAKGYFVLDHLNEKIRFSSIKVVGFMTYDVKEISWEHRAYGDAEVKYLQVPFENNTVTVVATEQPGQGPLLQLFLEKPADRNLVFKMEMEAQRSK